MYSLLADVGGTKTQLSLMDELGQLSHTGYYKNSAFGGFYDVLRCYYESLNKPTFAQEVDTAIIAVAGPVDNGLRCEMTNLSWVIDSTELMQKFPFKRAKIINDLQATAWGLTPISGKVELTMIRGAHINFERPVLVVSLGTGFGQTCIYPEQNSFIINATEGGHKTIAPFNQEISRLVDHNWRTQNAPLSWENWFSGSGLQKLYSAMFPDQISLSNMEISQAALENPNSDAGQCIQLFTQGIYSEAGNLLLQYLSWGGVILAGGIPPKIKAFFEQSDNLAYIHNKNEYQERLRQAPIALCERQDIPLRGAANYCLTQLEPIG